MVERVWARRQFFPAGLRDVRPGREL